MTNGETYSTTYCKSIIYQKSSYIFALTIIVINPKKQSYGKENGRDDPPKPQVAENEQMSDIILILDKMELILQAVSQIDKDGRYKTVPADKEHTNSFLKIDRYASMFENFLKNFWSQLKDPTRFGILSVKEKALDDPKVRQAIEDLAAGKRQTRWKNSSNSTRLSPATRKTKVSTIKIKKKWQKKMKHSSRPPKAEARSNSPSTATTSP